MLVVARPSHMKASLSRLTMDRTASVDVTGHSRRLPMCARLAAAYRTASSKRSFAVCPRLSEPVVQPSRQRSRQAIMPANAAHAEPLQVVGACCCWSGSIPIMRDEHPAR